MKKALATILLFSLTACSVPLGSDTKDNVFVIDGAYVEIAYTDDNTNEDIIIRSDSKDYFNPFGRFSFYFTVENLTGKSQNIDVVFFLNEGEILNIFQHDGISEEVIEDTQPVATSTERLGAETKYRTNWRNINIKQASIYQARQTAVSIDRGKLLGAMESVSVKSVDNKSADKQFTVYMADKEKLVFKGEMSKKNYEAENEFFIEAYGAQSGYGQLDPWTYSQSFDGLNTADLNGQDSWGSTNNVWDVSTDASCVFAGTKGLKSDNTDGTLGRTITAVSAGVMYAAVKYTEGVSGRDGPFFNLRNNSAGAGWVTIKYVAATEDYRFQIFAGSYKSHGPALSIDTWYILAIEVDKAGGGNGKYRIKVKQAGGSWSDWSDWETFAANVSSTGITILRIGIDAKSGFHGCIDEITADEDPDVPAAPTASTPTANIIYFE